ncbi:TRAP transporter small permease [Salibacterium sp. K-3]
MRKVSHFLNHTEEYFGSITLMGATFFVFLQVVLRYIFNFSLIWTEELARYLIIWFIFIGSSIAVRERAHAKVDVLFTIASANTKRILSIAASMMGLLFCILIVISGWQTIQNVTQYSNVTPALQIPMYVPYLAIPIGGTLMAVRFIQLIIEDYKKDHSDGTNQAVKGGERL